MKIFINTDAGNGSDTWQLLVHWVMTEEELTCTEGGQSEPECGLPEDGQPEPEGSLSECGQTGTERGLPEPGRTGNSIGFMQVRIEEAGTGEDGTGAQALSRADFLLSGCEGTCRVQVKGVKPWSPAEPALYMACIIYSCGGRETKVQERIGFRSIEKDGNKVFWNGEQIRLKGICYREKPGMAEDVLRRDLMLFKEADINYLRSIYGPFSQTMLGLCDELGFWTEDTAPLYGIGDSRPATQNSPAHLETDYMGPFRKMTEESFSHVSILLWSLGHDCIWGSNFRKMYQYIKGLDDIRLINFHLPMTIPDEEPQMDVWSVNYIDWRQPMDEHYDQMVIFHTQGAHNEIGYATGRAQDYTMPVLHDIYAPVPCRNLSQIERDPGIREFWGESLKRHWDKMESTPGCLGGAILAAIDEDGDALDGRGAAIPEIRDIKWGILDTGHNPKPEYHHVKMVYREHPDLVKKELPGEVVVTNRIYEYHFSRNSCLLTGAYARGTKVLESGPCLQATRLKLGKWQGKSLEILTAGPGISQGAALVTIRGSYGSVCDIEFTMMLFPDGKIRTEYEVLKLSAFMPHTVKAGIGLDPGGLDERGIAFRTAGQMDRFSWEREGLWDWYPEGHPYARSGSADSSEKENFHGMKHHIRRAVLSGEDSGAMIQVHSDGSHSVRLEDWPDDRMVTDDRDSAVVYEGSWLQMDDGCGNNMDTETMSAVAGDTASFRFEGTGVSVYGPTDIMYGKCDFILDGVTAAEGVSQYPKPVEFMTMSRGYEKRYRVCLFTVSGLEDKEHLLEVKVRGDKEPGAQDTYTSIDCFIVESPSCPVSQRLVINNDFNYTRLVQGNYMNDKVELKAGKREGCTISIGREMVRWEA